MTIHLAYQQILAQLYAVYDDREAANIADLLIEHATGQRKIDRIMYRDLPVSEIQTDILNNCVAQLLQHKPIQYVLHQAWFANMPLYVNEDVLIPRPETEELVDWVVRDIRAVQPRRADKFCILDVGTGSGCIPIAIKKQLPAHVVKAIDISEGALNVARQNAKAQQVEVTFIPLNFLSSRERETLERFDVIVSNPPYIKRSEASQMAKHVLEHEPAIALFVPDEDALVFYKALADFAQQHLTPHGTLYMEINEALGKEVVDLLHAYGFGDVELRKDLQGKDRMVRGRRGEK